MTRYEFLEEVRIYLGNKYNLAVIFQDSPKFGLSVYIRGGNNSKIKLGVTGYGDAYYGRTVNKEGEDFKKGVYEFINWVLQEEKVI